MVVCVCLAMTMVVKGFSSYQTSSFDRLSGTFQRLWRWFLQIPIDQRLLIWAVAFAVIPDLDVVFTPLFGWHTFHRGITHSIFVYVLYERERERQGERERERAR
jgi:membrane-bound metal-dependent hydrolase YbcI (DUF457 family)